MSSARFAAPVTPSRPNPQSSELGPEMMAPSGKPPAVVISHVFALVALPAGAGGRCQPPSVPPSKDFVPSPVET